MLFPSMSLCYNVDEMPRELLFWLVYGKMVSLYIFLLKVTEPIEEVK